MLSGQIERFNDYVRSRPESLSGFEMWDYTNAGRSSNRQPIPINDRLVKRNNFIFLGSLQPFETLDYERLMADWDRLLPLFEFVLARDDRALPTSKHPAFKQFSGRNIDLSSTQVARSAQTGVVDLAHNRLLAQLKHELAGEFGETNVLVEVSSGNGGTIDAVVVDGNSHIFYELKITASPQDCLRQAIGQLLEYAYWPGAGSANALVVVGEAALDAEGDRYLATLRERFSLPLTYRRIVKD